VAKRLTKAQKTVLDRIDRGKKLTENFQGYYWSDRTKVQDRVVDSLLDESLLVKVYAKHVVRGYVVVVLVRPNTAAQEILGPKYRVIE